MKRTIISLFVALLATVVVEAQQIAVVSKSGGTSIYQTLKDAIDGATSESVIYLPGGGFPIADDVKIKQKVTIIGIGYDTQSENPDGRTQISGNLFFEDGSDGSAVMGCYINGNVNIGTSEAAVHRVLIRYCNLNSVQVLNKDCLETEVNQCLIRTVSNMGNAKVNVTNNILHSLYRITGGEISYNIVVSYVDRDGYYRTFHTCNDCIIKNNVVLDNRYIIAGSNCQISGNMAMSNFGDDCVKLSGDWANIFENSAGVNPRSNYHFKESYKEYEGKYGIYGGTGFSSTTLPPVPYIFKKEIPDHTDASGKLHISIAVKAGGED